MFMNESHGSLCYFLVHMLNYVIDPRYLQTTSRETNILQPQEHTKVTQSMGAIAISGTKILAFLAISCPMVEVVQSL